MAAPSLTATRPSSPSRLEPAAPTPGSGRPRLLGAGLALLAGLPLVFAGLAYLAFDRSATIAPGVHVAGLDLGRVTVAEAAAGLDRLWNHGLQLQIVDPPTGRAWPILAAEVGLSVDARRTAEMAHAIGRTGTVVDAVRQAAAGLNQGVDLEPVVVLDRDQAARALLRIAAEADTPMQPAGIELADGVVRLLPGRDGRALNVDATLDLMAADPAALMVRYGFVPLIFSTLPASAQAAQAAQLEIDRLLAIPITLTAYDPVTDERLTWAPERVERAEWIAITPGEERIAVTLDEAGIVVSLQAWSGSLGADRQVDLRQATLALLAGYQAQPQPTLIIRYSPTPYATQGGETLAAIGYRHGFPTWKIEEYNPGVNPRAWLAPGTPVTLPPRDAMLLLPVVPEKRIVISISEQHLWAYERGALRSDHVISTGISRSPTLPGLFQVLSHYENAYASRWDLWMPHFLGIYDALPGFTNGIHGLPLLSSGVRLWGSVLGRPASYGCIILDLQAAEDIYTWADDGVVVEIRR